MLTQEQLDKFESDGEWAPRRCCWAPPPPLPAVALPPAQALLRLQLLTALTSRLHSQDFWCWRTLQRQRRSGS